MQLEMLKTEVAPGEGPPQQEMKRWIEFDKLVRREQQRKVAMGCVEKTKFSFEYTSEDWLKMLNLLPDIAIELDHEITIQKQKIKQFEAANEELQKKVNSVDNQVYTIQRCQESRKERENQRRKGGTITSGDSD